MPKTDNQELVDRLHEYNTLIQDTRNSIEQKAVEIDKIPKRSIAYYTADLELVDMQTQLRKYITEREGIKIRLRYKTT